MLKNLKGSPLSVFRHCETLARQGLALASPGAPLGPIFLVRNFFKKIFFKKFRFSSTVKEYLTLGSLFAIFEPWIWRRLGPVPACSETLCFSTTLVSLILTVKIVNPLIKRPLIMTLKKSPVVYFLVFFKFLSNNKPLNQAEC